jgi:hypothetical protein
MHVFAPSVMRAQRVVACYKLSYAPESLSKFLPPRVDLLATRHPSWRKARYTRWRVPAGWSDATQIVKLTRGYGEWWQQSDSLWLEAGEQITDMPFGRYTFGPATRGERAGTIFLVLSGDPSPPELRGTVRARRRACTDAKGAA